MIAALKRASDLTPGDVVLHAGQRLVVRSAEPTHKDGLRIRLRGHEPLDVRWDASVWVEVPTTPRAKVLAGAARTETEVTGEIRVVEAHLEALYTERRGRLVDGTGDGETAPAYGWCSNCGRVQVCASDGWDTCGTCTESA
jgi:hypothetical protein